MESAELRIFQAVAREGSITKAATKLGYVQSNLTARIRQLETELGTPLFHRHNRGMTLSAAGTELLSYADKIVGLLEEATRALSSGSEPSGPLAIGSTQTAAAVRLPKLLTSYYAKYPKVRLSLTTGHTQAMMDKVLRFELDGAFIGDSNKHPDLSSVPAFEERLTLVAPSVVGSLEEALERPLIVFSKGCSYRELLERWLGSIGLTNAATIELGTLEAILGGVGAGLGVSLMPRSVVAKSLENGTLRAYAIPERFSAMKTEFVFRKDSIASGALDAFLREVDGAIE